MTKKKESPTSKSCGLYAQLGVEVSRHDAEGPRPKPEAKVQIRQSAWDGTLGRRARSRIEAVVPSQRNWFNDTKNYDQPSYEGVINTIIPCCLRGMLYWSSITIMINMFLITLMFYDDMNYRIPIAAHHNRDQPVRIWPQNQADWTPNFWSLHSSLTQVVSRKSCVGSKSYFTS